MLKMAAAGSSEMLLPLYYSILQKTTNFINTDKKYLKYDRKLSVVNLIQNSHKLSLGNGQLRVKT
jgi:Tfp pilus assembly protein PilZ